MSRRLTRASNLHRHASCPGSALLEATLPELPESEDSQEGNELHGVLSAKFPNTESLTEDQFYCVSFCKSKEADLMKAVFFQETPSIGREVSLSLGSMEEFGHADVIMVSGPTALVIDYKFGRIPVEGAEANLQLRAYAVMVAEQYFCKKVFAAIIQPRVEESKRVTVVEYDLAAINASTEQIYEILSASYDPKSPLIPSESACRYCRAKATCPALATQAEALQKIPQDSITLSNSKELWRKCKIVEKHLDALKQRIFFTVQCAESENRNTSGLTLKPGATKRTVTNAQKAYSALAGRFDDKLTPDLFASTCSVKITALEKVFKDLSGLRATEAKEAMEHLLSCAGCLETKQNEPSLMEVEK